MPPAALLAGYVSYVQHGATAEPTAMLSYRALRVLQAMQVGGGMGGQRCCRRCRDGRKCGWMDRWGQHGLACDAGDAGGRKFGWAEKGMLQAA
eukprot:200527-Chlamydomonas_euryale.AAC.1